MLKKFLGKFVHIILYTSSNPCRLKTFIKHNNMLCIAISNLWTNFGKLLKN